MPQIANLTLAQLRAASKAQIISGISTWLANNMTKRQLIGFLMDADVLSDPPISTYYPDGQIESETTNDRDAETGSLKSTRIVHWQYYKTGEVELITIANQVPGEPNAQQTIIQHYLDGRQPSVKVTTTPAAFLSDAPIPTDLIAPRWVSLLIALVLIAAAVAITWYLLRGF